MIPAAWQQLKNRFPNPDPPAFQDITGLFPTGHVTCLENVFLLYWKIEPVIEQNFYY